MLKPATLLAVLYLASSAMAEDSPSAAADPPKALLHYVHQADDAFDWRLVKTASHDAGTVYQLRVTSQKWHDTIWRHAVEIYEPKNLQFPGHALLLVTGGSQPGPPGDGEMQMGMELATACGARLVMLHQTPNQPLLGNRSEDDLISETWLRYLDTGDETWPLLFPMVKSAVRTMDAVEAFSAMKFPQRIDRFVITGASKRGWTSWLTPVTDGRVIATAPIVIDILNFRAQMNHQLATWGSFSEQIIDYTSKGLVKRPGELETPRESALRTMMDPLTYRKQLTLPKLLIVGTNDPYWVVDAMNLYWDDLDGPKYIRQVPNAGHGLEVGRDGALTSLAVFFRHLVAGQQLPRVSWQFREEDRRVMLEMSASIKPLTVRFWTARSDDRDFRDARWRSSELPETNSGWVGAAEVRPRGYVAVLGEWEFDFEGRPWSLTTLVYRR